MTITVTMPDGVDTKPVEFYKALTLLCAGHNIGVHHEGAYSRLLIWDQLEQQHRLEPPDYQPSGLPAGEPSFVGLFLTDEAFTHCRPEVYDHHGSYVRLFPALPVAEPPSARHIRKRGR